MDEHTVCTIAEELDLVVERKWPNRDDSSELCAEPNEGSETTWWFLSKGDGELVEMVLLGIDGAEGIVVARPRWKWAGHQLGGPFVNSKDVRRVAAIDTAVEEARNVIRKRKKSLRRCHFCRERTVPEFGDGQGRDFVCYGCQTKEFGTVF